MAVRLFIIIILCTSCITSEIDVDILGGGASSIPQGNLSIVDNKLKLTLNETSKHNITNAELRYESTTYKLTVEKKTNDVFEFSPLINLEIESSKKFTFKYKSSGKWFLIHDQIGLPRQINLSSINGVSGRKRLFSNQNNSSWNDYFIREDTVINIPGDYSSLIEAMGYLASKRISSNALVTIQLADGIYNYSKTVDLSHLDLGRIKIKGNSLTPSSVTLNFFGISGFRLTSKNRLLELSGLKIVGDNSSGCHGIIVNSGSSININNIEITNFIDGFVSYAGGVAAGTNVTSSNNNGRGLFLQYGSAVALNNSNFSNNLDDGAFVGGGSSASLDSSIVNNNSGEGIEAWLNSYFAFYSGVASGNIGESTYVGRNSESNL